MSVFTNPAAIDRGTGIVLTNPAVNGSGTVLGGSITGPERSSFPGGVFAYGCPPIDPEPGQVLATLIPSQSFDLKAYKPEMFGLQVCAKCNQHVRVGEPCPFCLRTELDALKSALGDKAQPAETIATLKIALRKAIGALRDISRVTGGALEPIIADCEKALEAP